MTAAGGAPGTARDGYRAAAPAPTCAHCGVEVRTINYALGPELRHSTYPYRTSDTYWHCKQTVATLAAPQTGEAPETALERQHRVASQRLSQIPEAYR